MYLIVKVFEQCLNILYADIKQSLFLFVLLQPKWEIIVLVINLSIVINIDI